MSADATGDESIDAFLEGIGATTIVNFGGDSAVDGATKLQEVAQSLTPDNISLRPAFDSNRALTFRIAIDGVPSATVRLDARGSVDAMKFAQAVVAWTELVQSCPDAGVIDLRFADLAEEVDIPFRKVQNALWALEGRDGNVVVDRRAIDSDTSAAFDGMITEWDRAGWLYSRGDAPTTLAVRSAYFGGVVVAMGVKGRIYSDDLLHDGTEAVTGFSTPFGQVFDPPFEQWEPLAHPAGWDMSESRHWPQPPPSMFPQGRTKLASQVLVAAKDGLGLWATNSAAALANAAFLDACRPTRTPMGERYRNLVQAKGLLVDRATVAGETSE